MSLFIPCNNLLGVSVEVNTETDEEKLARLETVLLQDLRVLKHRHVIHPVLQEGELIHTHTYLCC